MLTQSPLDSHYLSRFSQNKYAINYETVETFIFTDY